jgi:hypothetical protein
MKRYVSKCLAISAVALMFLALGGCGQVGGYGAVPEAADVSATAAPTPLVLADAAAPTDTSAAIASTGGPKLSFVVAEHNLGTVENVGPIPLKFTVRNTGDSDLIISSIKPTCGCTMAELERNTIPPGEETFVTGELSLPNKVGHVKRTIQVLSNDPTNPSAVLTMQGNLVQRIVWSEKDAWIRKLSNDSVASKTLRLHSPSEVLKFNIDSVRVVDKDTKKESPYFTASLKPTKDGYDYDITVTTVPPLPDGMTATTLEVETDNDVYKTITLKGGAVTIKDLMVSPKNIMLPGDLAPTDLFNRNILVRPGLVETFTITEVELPVGAEFGYTIKDMDTRGILVELKDIKPTADLLTQEVIIRTDVASMPEIRVGFKIRIPTAQK